MPIQHSRLGAVLRNAALLLAAFTFVFAWLPLVRCIIDGPSYQWGASYFGHMFHGAGLGGDFWFLVAQTIFAAATLYLGFRRPGVVSYALLSGWMAINAANVVNDYRINPEGLVFQGDTLGVSVNIGLVAMVLFCGGLALTVAGSALEYSGARRPPRFAWTRVNTIVLIGALALLPIQFALLRFATGRELADQAGVILTMLQCVALVVALSIARKHPV